MPGGGHNEIKFGLKSTFELLGIIKYFHSFL